MTTVDVIDDPVHGPLVHKQGLHPAEQRRLDHERELLRAAQHPGVVELLDDAELGEGVVTRFVGPDSLETLGPMSVGMTAGLVAAVADTIADLHELGIVHGRVEPAHVVLDPGGRPVLCGFGSATYVGTVAPTSAPLPPELTDPAHPVGAPAETSLDVFGLGAVLRLLLEDAGTEAEPIPDRRLSLGRLRHPWSGYHRRALLNLADQATADDPMRRPTARELASSVRDVLPPNPDGPDPMASLRLEGAVDAGRGRRVGTLVAAVAGLALLFVGLSSLLDSPAPPTTSASAVTTIPPEPEAKAAPPSAPACAPAVSPPAADIDGDGCADGTAVVDGSVVTVGAVRFAVGSEGDAVVVGDLSCTGLATVAVLRRTTGEVFEFASWPSEGSEATAHHVGDAPGAVSLRLSSDACPALQAIGADGAVEELS